MTHASMVTSAIAGIRLVPVVVIHDVADAESLAAALESGGLPVADVTIRPAAEAALPCSSNTRAWPRGPAPCCIRRRWTHRSTRWHHADYLSLPSVLAVGGSWMVAPQLLAERRFDEVRRLAAQAVAIRAPSAADP